jgi:hypothetical protein
VVSMSRRAALPSRRKYAQDVIGAACIAIVFNLRACARFALGLDVQTGAALNRLDRSQLNTIFQNSAWSSFPHA